jgi:hypothetical protein
MAETLRQRAPAYILNREEMQGFQEQAIIPSLAPAPGQARPKYRKRVRPILFVHPRRHRSQPPIRSELYESQQILKGNTKNYTAHNSSTRPMLDQIRPHGLGRSDNLTI